MHRIGFLASLGNAPLIPFLCSCVIAFMPFQESLGDEGRSASSNSSATKIVLIAGETAKIDDLGHHDYIAGCKCLKFLLEQSQGVSTEIVLDGWPKDESLFDGARSIVFYTDGGGKQAFLQPKERAAKVESLIERGVGVVMIHQAVDFPEEWENPAKKWLGGIYLKSTSGRGHWPSNHVEFPKHPITEGVQPWKINDGWLNGISFVPEMKGIIPLVWSGKEYAGSRAGLDRDIVAWGYERSDGGRSFSFTGLDAHSAWSLPGMRQLVVNGVLWSAGRVIPTNGAPCEISEAQLEQMLTPREPKKKPEPKPKQPAKTIQTSK